MKNNSSQSWIIALSVVAVALFITLMLTGKYKNQRQPDQNLEIAYQQAKEASAYLPPKAVPEPIAIVEMPTQKYQYAIQIISLSDQAKAQDVLNKLTGAGFTGYVAPADLGDKGIKYRVFAGPFYTKDDANTKLPEVKAIYNDAFILKI